MSMDTDMSDSGLRELLGRKSALAPISVLAPKKSYRDEFAVVAPRISPLGVHEWPFDRSCPVDVLFLASNRAHDVPMNRHEYFEVIYLCQGSAECHIRERTFRFDEGDLAVIGSGVPHRISSRSATGVRLAALFFEPDLIRSDGGDSVNYLTPFEPQDAEFPRVLPATCGVPMDVLEMMARIGGELPVTSIRARLAVKTYLRMLLLSLVNYYSPVFESLLGFRQRQTALDRLQPLFDYLKKNYGNAISVPEAGRLCGMSESYFMSYFKQSTGVTFGKYLNHYRIRRAQESLAQTDEPLAAIGSDVGFCDQSYFGATFRKLVGMTPATYRQLCRGKSPEVSTDRPAPLLRNK